MAYMMFFFFFKLSPSVGEHFVMLIEISKHQVIINYCDPPWENWEKGDMAWACMQMTQHAKL